jgi:hypothetical protein
MERVDYKDLHTIYPTEELESETYKINRIVLSEESVTMEHIRHRRNYWYIAGLKADFPYVRLIKKGGSFSGGGIMMSDTPMERNTNYDFIQKANGDVIIFGLGLGLIVIPLLKKENVKSILVVELHQDLIDLVEPILKQHDPENKLTIVQGDCFEFHTKIAKERKFDSIYGDIWIDISTDNYDEMKTLTKNWKNHVNRSNPNAFIDHWLKDHLKNKIQNEKRDRYYW